MSFLRWYRPFTGFCLASCLLSAAAFAQQGVVLVNGSSLLPFSAGTVPTSTPVTITGLNSGETLVGIDYRPVNRTLVGLTTANRLVTLNPSTGAATLLSVLDMPLAGTAFGVDFNPVPDRLRVISDTGLNFRINVDTGAVTRDGTLAYAANDAGAGAPPAVAGAGYTNSVGGQIATSTALYNIDYERDVLLIQNPPNDGVLCTVGPLGVNVSALSGFDIFSPSMAYGSFVVGGQTGLYQVNLSTGAATLVSTLPTGVIDLALVPKEAPQGIINTSARGWVSPGEGVLITGFVISGPNPVNVLVNSRGPSLSAFGIAQPLSDTWIAVYRGSTLLAQNDDWQTSPRAAEIAQSALAPGSPKESSLLLTLTPGAYTVVVHGPAGASGVAIAEVYEMN